MLHTWSNCVKLSSATLLRSIKERYSVSSWTTETCNSSVFASFPGTRFWDPSSSSCCGFLSSPAQDGLWILFLTATKEKLRFSHLSVLINTDATLEMITMRWNVSLKEHLIRHSRNIPVLANTCQFYLKYEVVFFVQNYSSVSSTSSTEWGENLNFFPRDSYLCRLFIPSASHRDHSELCHLPPSHQVSK